MTLPEKNKRNAGSLARRSGWLPGNNDKLALWLADIIEKAGKANHPYHPEVEEFRHLIETDPEVNMYFNQMFEQVPQDEVAPPEYGDIRIRDYNQLLYVLNYLLTHAPVYNHTEMVGVPINAVMDYVMWTPAGFSAFLSDKVNKALKKILNKWGQFLDSKESLAVLNETPAGWMCPGARKDLKIEQFKIEEDKPHWGFKSWNDFFIRQFKDGERPVAEPGNNKIIVNACESVPFSLRTNVKKFDKFWLKNQPYSLQHMLAGHYVDEFAGGTVYQAMLSALNYHRWHSPVSGTIKKVVKIDGSYFAEAYSVGFEPIGNNNSQGFIAHTATRALIFINADDPVIGLMCVIPIGMVEVSSCLVTVKEGEHVNKGQQLGYFQFGGSTHCLVFRPNVIKAFVPGVIPPEIPNFSETTGNILVNAMLAEAN